MSDLNHILSFCKNCHEETLEGVRAEARAAGIHLCDETIERLILRPRLAEAYIPPQFDLEHYKRHL